MTRLKWRQQYPCHIVHGKLLLGKKMCALGETALSEEGAM